MNPGSLGDGQRLLVVLLPCFGMRIRDDEDKKDDIDDEDGDEDGGKCRMYTSLRRYPVPAGRNGRDERF